MIILSTTELIVKLVLFITFLSTNRLLALQSPVNAETGSAQDETSSSGNKEDEDDDDDESDDKIDAQSHDPERLKAFNVR